MSRVERRSLGLQAGAAGLVRHALLHGLGDAGGIGQVVEFELVVGHDGVEAGDALDGGLEVEEAVLLDRGRQRAMQMGLHYFGALTPQEAYTVWVAGSGARLIDVRTRAEWDWVGRIPGSVEIEWNAYPGGQRNSGFLDELARSATEADAPLLFICRSGGRSDHAARLATAMGYTRCINVLEGFEGDKDSSGHRGTVGGWRKAGLPWVQG